MPSQALLRLRPKAMVVRFWPTLREFADLFKRRGAPMAAQEHVLGDGKVLPLVDQFPCEGLSLGVLTGVVGTAHPPASDGPHVSGNTA